MAAKSRPPLPVLNLHLRASMPCEAAQGGGAGGPWARL